MSNSVVDVLGSAALLGALGCPGVAVERVDAARLAEAVEHSARTVVAGGRAVVDAHETGVARQALVCPLC